MKDKEIILNSERLIYIKPSYDLIDDYLIMVNNLEIQQFISKHPKQYTKEDEYNWITKKLGGDKPIFSVLEKDTNKFVGNVEFFEDDEIGICITPDFQNMHYGTEILKTMIKYAKEVLGQKEVCLSVFSHNERAIHCYEKLGFKEYKRDKNIAVIDGKEIDDVYMKLS